MSATLELEELVAVNEELAALVRAGVPLEATLGDMGRDLPGRMGRAVEELADRIAGGASLPQALAAMPKAFPPIYRAAVDAGLRAGRLPVVLEDLSTTARRTVDLRRTISVAGIYPFVILLITINLFVFFITKLLPSFVESFEGHVPTVVRWMASIRDSVPVWGAGITNVLAVVAALVWFYLRGSRSTFDWLLGLGSMRRNAQLATFADTLGLLLDHNVPLGDATQLAAQASGNGELVVATKQFAHDLDKGSHRIADNASARLPGFFVWLVNAGCGRETLIPMLRQTAELHRRQVLRRADWIRMYLPILMTLGIGGTAVLLYALALFVPLTQLLQEIAVDNPLTW